MSCKCRSLKVRLLEHVYNAIVTTKKHGVNLVNKYFRVEAIQKEYNLNCKRKEYGVSFCVSYRPVGFNERILARGRRNDKGIWTPDGIFNDGKI